MPAFTYGNPPVRFLEAMEGSQDAAVSRTAQVYKAIWKVAWADVEAAKVALLGRTVAMPASGSPPQPAYFSRQLPHAHPKAPWLFATDITRTEGRLPRGKNVDDGTANYVWAFLYTTYTKLGCAVLPDSDTRVQGAGAVPDESKLARFVRKRRRNATQYFTATVGGWKWLDNGLPVPMPIPWRRPMLRVLLTWMNVPVGNLAEGFINDTIGTTNKNAFGGFGAESLLLNGADWPEWFPIVGQDGFQVDVTFDILYYPTIWLNTDPPTGISNGPNFFPDPQRFQELHEVGQVITLSPLVVNGPIPVRDWAPMFQPINV